MGSDVMSTAELDRPGACRAAADVGEASNGWISVWARAQRGTQVEVVASRACFEMELVNTYGAHAVRFRFAGRYDEMPFDVAGEVEIAGDCVPITFEGAVRATVPAGGELVSDAILLSLPGSDIVEDFSGTTEEANAPRASDAALHFRYEVASLGVCTSGFGLEDYDIVRFVHPPVGTVGDRPDNFLAVYPTAVFGLAGIDLFRSNRRGCVAFFGDSICEIGTYFRPARLVLERRGYVAVNMGISGNRLTRSLMHVDPAASDAPRELRVSGLLGPIEPVPLPGQAYGIAGRDRFAWDVCALSGVSAVVAGVGVNDIIHPGTFCGLESELPRLEEFIDAYRAIADAVDGMEKQGRHPIPLIWLPITPFSSEKELSNLDAVPRAELRRQVNAALSAFAGESGADFVELDSALATGSCAADPALFVDDLLHPNIAGGAVMFTRLLPFLPRTSACYTPISGGC